MIGGFSSGFGINDWQWVTGETFSFTNWGPLEPFGNGDRISYFGFQSSTVQNVWNDIGADRTDPRGYIIETSSLLAAPIPEPSTMLLLGSGLAGLGWYRRRRKAA